MAESRVQISLEIGSVPVEVSKAGATFLNPLTFRLEMLAAISTDCTSQKLKIEEAIATAFV